MPTEHAIEPVALAWERARWGAAAAPAAAESHLAYELLQSVFGEVAHALGNPLTGLTLTLERLQQLATEPKVAKLATRIEQAAERLAALKTLWGQLGAGTCEGAPEEVTRAQLFAWAERHAAVPGRKLALHVAPETPALAAHNDLFFWVLGELLDNAERHGSGALGLDVRPHNSHVRLTMWQEQGALPPALIAPLWREPLGRAHGKGKGAGLLLVAFITEGLHHGQVAYVPGMRQGAAMVVDVPARS